MKILNDLQFEEYKLHLKMTYDRTTDTAILDDSNETIGSYSIPDSFGFLNNSVYYDQETYLLDKQHYDYLDKWLDEFALEKYEYYKELRKKEIYE